MNWVVIAGLVVPWIILGASIAGFILSGRNWKKRVGGLVQRIIESTKDGKLTVDEAYDIVQWLFEQGAKKPAIEFAKTKVRLREEEKEK